MALRKIPLTMQDQLFLDYDKYMLELEGKMHNDK